MNPSIEYSDVLLRVLIRYLNGIITIGISFPVLKLYFKNQRRFYLHWGVGFLFYGINIIVRAYFDYQPGPYWESFIWLIFIFYYLGFMNIIVGIGDLIGHAKGAFASSILLLIIPALIYLLPNDSGFSVIAAAAEAAAVPKPIPAPMPANPTANPAAIAISPDASSRLIVMPESAPPVIAITVRAAAAMPNAITNT